MITQIEEGIRCAQERASQQFWAKVGATIRATAAAEAAVLKAQTAEEWAAAKEIWEHAKIVEAAAWALAEQQTEKPE